MGVQAEIESLSRERQRIWFSAEPYTGQDVARIGSRLADLFEQKRHQRARVDPARRADIVRRARVESELERLIDRR